MAKCTVPIQINVDPKHQIEKLARGFERLTETEQVDFHKEWKTLENLGAQVADCGFCYGIVHAWLSYDMVRHATRFGIDL
ncbi:MAG: hypothetical protein ACKVLA_11425 [Rhodobacterales bacterium]